MLNMHFKKNFSSLLSLFNQLFSSTNYLLTFSIRFNNSNRFELEKYLIVVRKIILISQGGNNWDFTPWSPIKSMKSREASKPSNLFVHCYEVSWSLLFPPLWFRFSATISCAVRKRIIFDIYYCYSNIRPVSKSQTRIQVHRMPLIRCTLYILFQQTVYYSQWLNSVVMMPSDKRTRTRLSFSLCVGERKKCLVTGQTAAILLSFLSRFIQLEQWSRRNYFGEKK
jgi:hypothetical protein